MRCTLLLLGTLLSATTARAEGSLVILDPPPGHVTAWGGASVWSFPDYLASRRQRWVLLPALDVNTPSGAFASTDVGIGWNLSARPDVQWGPRLWPLLGRTSRASAVSGDAGIGPRWTKGGFFNWQPAEFLLLQSSAMTGAGRRGDGMTAEIGGVLGLPVGQPDNDVGLTASVTWANRAFRQSYLTSAPEREPPQLAATWQPAGGWQDASLGVTAEARLSPRWKLSGQISAVRLLGSVAQSPLTQSRTHADVSLSLWRSWE